MAMKQSCREALNPQSQNLTMGLGLVQGASIAPRASFPLCLGWRSCKVMRA